MTGDEWERTVSEWVATVDAAERAEIRRQIDEAAAEQRRTNTERVTDLLGGDYRERWGF